MGVVELAEEVWDVGHEILEKVEPRLGGDTALPETVKFYNFTTIAYNLATNP